MEVRIKHIRPQEWSGIHKYPSCGDVFKAYYTRSGRIHTGLSKEDSDRLSDILGVDLRPQSKFWNDFKIRLGSEDVVLNTEDPFDELKYLFLKAHKRIAPSLAERKPDNIYYISIKEQEAIVANEYSRIKRKAYKEFDKMSKSDIKKALRIYGYKADNISDEVAEERLMTLLESNPARFFEKWVDNKNRQTEYLIKEAVSKNVVRKNKNIYSYGTTVLGNNLDDAILFIDNAENSDIKAAIINETEVK